MPICPNRVLSGAIALSLLLAPVPLVALQDVPTPPREQVRPYEVGRALPPLDDGRVMVSLTLEEAVAFALENNLDIRSARLNPEIQTYAYRAALASFTPTFNSTLGYNSSATQSTSQLDGGSRISSDRQTFNFSLTQPLQWAGSQFGANFNNNRTATDNIFATRNPSYGSTLTLNFTQPLLAGRRIDNQRNALRTQEIQRTITDTQLRGQIENLSAQVRATYWNLRATIEQIEIQQLSLAQAQRLYDNNRIRVELGTMVEMELAQSEAQVASAEQALLNAEIQWRNQEMALKRLLVGGTDDPLFSRTIHPVDVPDIEEVTVDIASAIEAARRNRPELEMLRRQRQISDFNLDVTRENTKPNLNLNLSYGLQGVGGDLFERTQLGGEPTLVERGGYLDGLAAIGERESPSFNASVTFSYPIGTRASQMNLEQARLQLRQTDLNLQAQELQVETEVTSAGMAVSNAFLQLEAARRSRIAAERSAEAEATRFNVGVSTNFQVVQAQNQLTSARLSELQAMINYVNAVAEFERVQGIEW